MNLSFSFLLSVFLFSTLILGSGNLLLVQTITRHGDRVATHPISADPATWTCTQHTVAPSSQDSIIEYIIPPAQLYRSLFILNRQSLLGNCTEGQLTDIGQQQTNDLGLQLRKVYHDFISDYNDPQLVYVRSSYTNRCQQSARNLLDGLFPPIVSNQSLTIPIWLIEDAHDDMQINIKSCPAVITQLIETILQNPADAIRLVEPLIPFLPQISSIFNTSRPIIAAFRNYDNCNCRQFHNISLPNGMRQTVFNAMQKSYWYGGQLMFNSSAAISVGSFIQELIDFMDQKIAGDLSYKFQLFSGHDTTVGPVLAYFQLYDGTWPPYASHIQWNLFEDAGSYYVQFWYNDKLQVIPGCGQANCPYGIFKSIALAQVPTDPIAACSILPLRDSGSEDDLEFMKTLREYSYLKEKYGDIPLAPGIDTSVLDFVMAFITSLMD